MDKTIRAFTSLQAMKADEYEDWQARSAAERMLAVTEITLATYKMKEPTLDVRRLQRTTTVIQRPAR